MLSDVTYDMGSPDAAAGLVKDGVERDLQELLADRPEWCGEGFRLVRREWPTDIGPVDLMCRDEEDGWIAVEITRVATIEPVGDRGQGDREDHRDQDRQQQGDELAEQHAEDEEPGRQQDRAVGDGPDAACVGHRP